MRLDLYNNPKTEDVLKSIGLTEDMIPRFRGAGVDNGKICVHTRTGGGNRDYYENEESCRINYPEYFEGDSKPSGPWNDDLRKNKYYIRDEDDDSDCTYANFWFRIPSRG